MANLPQIAVVTSSKLPSTGMYSNYLLYTCISERHPTCRIATSQMQAPPPPPPPQTLNLVLAINKHLKLRYVPANSRLVRSCRRSILQSPYYFLPYHSLFIFVSKIVRQYIVLCYKILLAKQSTKPKVLTLKINLTTVEA